MPNWGIIGTGTIAFEMAYAIQSVVNNRISAISSRTPANAKIFGDTLGVTNIYTDYLELLKDDKVDIVYIALPNSLHAEVMKACLEHGKHILCEKPFTMDAGSAQEIKTLANEKGLFCMEAYWTRFIPSVQKVKEMLEEGTIGKIRMVRGSFGHIAMQERSFDAKLGGGVLLDLGPYPLGLTYALFGRPEGVSGNTTSGPSGVDIQGSIQMEYNSGILVYLMCSYVTELDNEYVIYGERGSIKLTAPIYRSALIEVTHFAEKEAPDNKASAGRNYFNLPTLLKSTPYIMSQVRRYLPKKAKSIRVPFKGSGYQYQIRHINTCLDSDLIESPIYSLEATIEVLKILDKVKKGTYFSDPK